MKLFITLIIICCEILCGLDLDLSSLENDTVICVIDKNNTNSVLYITNVKDGKIDSYNYFKSLGTKPRIFTNSKNDYDIFFRISTGCSCHPSLDDLIRYNYKNGKYTYIERYDNTSYSYSNNHDFIINLPMMLSCNYENEGDNYIQIPVKYINKKIVSSLDKISIISNKKIFYGCISNEQNKIYKMINEYEKYIKK